MRIAAISDIHGNRHALEAVLADIGRRGVDRTVNLGDILSGPLDPVATADRLMNLKLPTIRGNHERQLLSQSPEHMIASDRVTHEALGKCHRAWLDSLPETIRFDDVLLCHGTPTSDLIYLLDHVEEAGARAATAAEIEAKLGDEPARLILCGHTHLQREYRRPNGALVVNPGSVGLQAYDDDHPFPHVMEMGDVRARYAIVERVGDEWRAELIAVDYDHVPPAAQARAKGREDWAYALETGRVAGPIT